MIHEEKPTNRSIRKVNQENVLRILLREGEATRKVLAEQTQVSLMTVKSIVDNLLSTKVLVEKDADNYGSLGRRPKLLQLAPRIGVVACINLSFKDSFDYHLFSVHGELLLQKRIEHTPQGAYRDNLKGLIALMQSDLSHLRLDLMSVGILVPGAYYEQEDSVNFDLIAGLKELPIKHFFKKQLGVNNVGVFHDVFAGAQAEFDASLPRSDSMFYFFAGDGIGGAFITSSGNWLRGENLLAGEIGQCVVGNGDGECILEDCVSTYELAKRTGLKGFRQVLQSFQAGDRLAVDAIEEAARTAANSLHNVIWILNPGRLVIASPYREYAEIILEACRSRTKRFDDLPFPMSVSMGLSRYKDHAEVHGCFSLSLSMWIDSLVE